MRFFKGTVTCTIDPQGAPIALFVTCDGDGPYRLVTQQADQGEAFYLLCSRVPLETQYVIEFQGYVIAQGTIEIMSQVLRANC